MKKILKVFLAMALLFVSFAPVNVLAEQSSNLMTIITGMYEGTNDFEAYDEAGDVVTTSFLNAIEPYYSSNDEQAITDYMASNIAYLNRKIVTQMPTPYSATYTKCYVSEEFAELLAQTQPTGGGSILITYLVTAEPIYVKETSQVLTNPQPNVTLTSANLPINLVKLFSISSMTSLSTDQKTITYSWTFQTRARVSQYVDTYELAFERVNRSMTVTPSTY